MSLEMQATSPISKWYSGVAKIHTKATVKIATHLHRSIHFRFRHVRSMSLPRQKAHLKSVQNKPIDDTVEAEAYCAIQFHCYPGMWASPNLRDLRRFINSNTNKDAVISTSVAHVKMRPRDRSHCEEEISAHKNQNWHPSYRVLSPERREGLEVNSGLHIVSKNK